MTVPTLMNITASSAESAISSWARFAARTKLYLVLGFLREDGLDSLLYLLEHGQAVLHFG